MNGLINTITADRITRSATWTSLVVLLVTLVYLLFFYHALPPFLPLFNQMAWGDPRLSDKWVIFLLPGIAFGILIANTIFASFLYSKMPLIARMMTITNLLVALLNLIFIFRITQLLL